MALPSDLGEALERVLGLMAKHGATRVVVESGGERFEVDRPFIEPVMPQTVPANKQRMPVPPGADPDEPKDLECPCGHSLEVEHNSAGCLLGCSVEQCLEKKP